MPDGRRYYVTMQDIRKSSRYILLLGPFNSHDEALAKVDDARRVASRLDPWTDFAAFGTGSIAPGLIAYPEGRLNSHVQ